MSTMIAQTFEIKVALIGYVSVGKTTVLNALLRDKYGEVSMRRTTAGVNYFRISAASSGKLDEPVGTENRSVEWSMVADDVRTAASTLEEISADNAKLRESDKVEEKTFDIELDEQFCEMRKDTKLVIVDIPGINEAGASSKYKDYVAKKWHTFDCAIVVMDAKQGVNTQDQVELLKFVKTNLQEKKDVPVIILANKVDEPDDEEQELLVSEARSEVEEIFGVTSRDVALNKLLREAEANTKFATAGGAFPAFIPTSAIHAFIYQTASLMDFERFKTFDQDLIERLGREQIGKKKWKRLSRGEKHQAVFDVIADPRQYKEGLEETNFNKFITILAHCIGGTGRQTEALKQQIDVEISLISYGGCIATQLQSIYYKCKALNRDPGFLKTTFRNVYKQCEDNAFVEFKDDAKAVDCLAGPMEQLLSYSNFVGKVEWKDEKAAVAGWMKTLVQRQLEVIFNAYSSWLKENKHTSIWNELSKMDLISIVESLLLLSYNMHFCEVFGKEKIFLEGLRQTTDHRPGTTDDCCPGCFRKLDRYRYCSGCCRRFRFSNSADKKRCPSCRDYGHGYNLDSNGRCNSRCGMTFEEHTGSENHVFQYKYTNGKFVPVDAERLKDLVHIEVPDTLSDPKHFGHLAWKFCQFTASSS